MEERIAEILRKHHLWDEKYLAHVASELVAELGLTEERAVGGHGPEPLATAPADVAVIQRFGWAKPLRRYITPWTPA